MKTTHSSGSQKGLAYVGVKYVSLEISVLV